MSSALPEIIVDRGGEDRTEYLCTHAPHTKVLRSSLTLGNGRFKHQDADVGVTRWHADEHQDATGHITLHLNKAPFNFAQCLSSEEARAFAAALVQAANELDLEQAACTEGVTC